MNILVIGNGFDLAHELPTRYKDFLEWIKAEYALYFEDCRNRSVASDAVKVDWPIKISPSKITVKAINNVNIQTEIWECINNNFWIDYFLNNSRYINENWIDFESEVSKVIQSLDNDMHGLNETYNLDDEITDLSNNFLREKYSEYTFVVQQINMLDGKESLKSITFKEIRNRLLNDINKLIRALEIYLAGYVNKIQNGEESSDIKDIFEKKDEQGNITAFIDTKIVSFNYTTTFNRIYKHSFDIDYIHGKADINNTIDTNNMVLGIDEYLPKKKKE